MTHRYHKDRKQRLLLMLNKQPKNSWKIRAVHLGVKQGGTLGLWVFTVASGWSSDGGLESYCSNMGQNSKGKARDLKAIWEDQTPKIWYLVFITISLWGEFEKRPIFSNFFPFCRITGLFLIQSVYLSLDSELFPFLITTWVTQDLLPFI